MYLFRDPPNNSKKKDQTAIEVSRKRRIGFSVEIRIIENRTTIPMELSDQAKKNEAFFRARKDAQKVIALFEERPIWSKVNLKVVIQQLFNDYLARTYGSDRLKK